MKVIISHPTGNVNVRNAVKTFDERNSLFCFITALNISIKKNFLFFLPKFILKELNRRSYKGYTTKIITTASFFEWKRLITLKFFKWFIRSDDIDILNKKIDFFTSRHIQNNKNKVNAIYAYADGALDSFKEAKKHSIKCIYEYPAPHYNFNEVRLPIEKRKRQDLELKLADMIIVPSSWAAKSFSHFSEYKSKIYTVPYGFPEKVNVNRNNWYNGKKPLKILYAGALSYRKGIPFLIKALNKIPNNLFDMTFLGSGIYENRLKKKFPNSKFINSCPHEDVLKIMRKNDVFVFPSLSDGFGLVISEAMSQGMAVIATKNTALKDIYNGSNSILIPAKDENKIYKSILFLMKNSNKVKEIGLSALKYSKKNSWKKYRKKLYKIILSHS